MLYFRPDVFKTIVKPVTEKQYRKLEQITSDRTINIANHCGHLTEVMTGKHRNRTN